MDPAEKAAYIERLNGAFTDFVPHNKALGMRFVDFDEGMARIELPWAPHLVGHPETGTVHGGVISSLLDATGGAAVFMRIKGPTPIATLDMRVDYMKPATPQRAITAKCVCYKLTSSVGFVRGVAFHDDEDDPIASMAATYMINTRGETALNAGETK